MISVCMATYNGAEFIREQIDSILEQLSLDDELIVCDDCSTDSTVKIVESYGDERIKLVVNSSNLGHVKNFEKAISLAKGELIALSDQDDVWYPERLNIMAKTLISHSAANLLASNFDMSSQLNGSSLAFRGLSKKKQFALVSIINIFLGRVPYFGCTFLMRRQFIMRVLPFPNTVEAHDVWLALLANTYGSVVHLEESTLFRRIHSNNLTPTQRRPWTCIVKSRIVLGWNYFAVLLSWILKG
jgi:glycosyltransferase involved in cell wall biosynthesis